MTTVEKLRAKANSLPETPGIYIMKDSGDNIIYVGKSKKLKNRVVSYFSGTHTSAKTARMVSLVSDFDFILCKTEMEALTLENVLIKKHSPKYNIKLKDAKSYPYIKISAGEYPSLFVTRERKSDKGRYFGPYQSAAGAYSALETVKKIFSLPTCKRSFPRDIGKERPCIYKDMGRCIAPCAGGVSKEEYAELVKNAAFVLDGNVRSTLASLTEEMLTASEDMNFEKAALIRDRISALKKLSEKQKVVADAKIMRDVFAFYTDEVSGVLATLSVREGSLVAKSEFQLSTSEPILPSDLLNLILNHYESGISIPKEILLGFEADEEDIDLLAEYLTLIAKRRVTVRYAERGDGRALCDMAYANAKEHARVKKEESQRENMALKRL